MFRFEIPSRQVIRRYKEALKDFLAVKSVRPALACARGIKALADWRVRRNIKMQGLYSTLLERRVASTLQWTDRAREAKALVTSGERALKCVQATKLEKETRKLEANASRAAQAASRSRKAFNQLKKELNS